MAVKVYKDSEWKVISGSGGSNLTLTNGGDNRVITATGAAALTAEDNLTFDGITLNATKIRSSFTTNVSTGGGTLTLSASDIGKVVITDKQVNIPSSISTFSVGDAITIINSKSTGTIVINPVGDDGVSLILAGGEFSGPRTLKVRGVATIILIQENLWVITGMGLS